MRYLLLFLLIIPLSSNAFASSELQSNDLSQLSASAKKEKLPILLIVSQHHCPFCVRLREEIISPAMIGKDYEGKAVIAEIFLDSSESIHDFQGKPVRPGVIAESYNVWVTPTLLFLDHTGREIHKRMLGVNTIEMFSYYLEQSLSAALSAVRQEDQSYVPALKDISGDAPGYDQR